MMKLISQLTPAGAFAWQRRFRQLLRPKESVAVAVGHARLLASRGIRYHTLFYNYLSLPHTPLSLVPSMHSRFFLLSSKHICTVRPALISPTQLPLTRHLHVSHRRSSAIMSALTSAVVSSPNTLSASPSDVAGKAHHNKHGKGFVNPWPSYIERSGPRLGLMMLWRLLTGKFKSPDTTPPTVPIRKPSFLPTRQTDCLRATWLGHACYYVEFPSGLRVLFDPVFTERCSPFSFMGPKRFTEMPCEVEDIPFIDAVVISHSHYDHLSLSLIHI